MDKKGRVILVSIGVNTFLSIIKIIGGIIGKSRTILVDGIHSLSDLITDLFSLMGVKASLKPADSKHPFGHSKLENIFSLFMGILIVFVGVIVLKNSFFSKRVIPSWWLIILVGITILLKYLLSRFVYLNGIKHDSPILVNSAKESMMDVLSSTFAFIVVLLSLFSDKIKFLKYIDLLGGSVISLFIIYTGLNIIKNESSSLIGEVGNNSLLIDKVKNRCEQKIESIKLIRYGAKYLLFINIYLDENMILKEIDKIINNLENEFLKEKSIQSVIIKVLPIKE